MDFVYLIRFLLKRKWLIIGAGLLAAVVAYFFTRNEPKKYRSIAQISTGFTISDEIKVNNENFSFYEADVKFNNAIITFMSPTVISLLSYNLILHDLEKPVPFRYPTQKQAQSSLYKSIDKGEAIKIFGNKLESMSMLTSFKPEEKKLLELLSLYGYDYKSLSNVLGVNRLQRSDYIQVEFTSENPELSAFIVNSVFQQFIRYYKNVRSSRSQESIDTLQSLLEKKKQDLDAKNAQLRSEGVMDVGLENSSKLEIIMNLETALTDEQTKQTQRSYDLQKINQKLSKFSAGTGASTANNKNMGGSADELEILKNARNQAYIAYINSGSSDQALLKKYETLKAEYETKAAQSPDVAQPDNSTVTAGDTKAALLDKKNDLETDVKAGSTNIDVIQNKINGLKGNLIKDASKGAVIETLLKDAELANKEYLAAKQKYNDAADINTSPVNNFHQILSGQPAIEPEPSKRILILAMAGACTAILTILVLVLIAYLDTSIKSPTIFAKTINLKLISMINFMNIKPEQLAEIITAKEDPNDVTENKKYSVFRESLRKLRYEIENSGMKTFLFASTKKGQGKTTLIQALSYSMSLSKKKILIIDTNFCNNDLTVQLKADPILEKIHTDNYNSKALIEQVKHAAKDIGVGSVFIIGSQGGDYTPSEILPRDNLLQQLPALKEEYDYIFLEGPPLNDFSHAKELTQYVDGVIGVFSANITIKQIDKQSLAFFYGLNGKFYGAVLNMVDLSNINAS